MIESMLYFIALIALAVSSFTDIKKREVPDWISYGLVFSALGIRLLFSIFNGNYSYIIEGISGFALFFALSCLLYYSKQWGGGDAKILMGVGAILGLDIFNINSYIDLGLFIVLLIFLGAIYSIIFSFFLAYKNVDKFRKSFRKNVLDFKLLVQFVSVLLGVGVISLFLIDDFNLSLFIFGISLLFFTGIFSFIFARSVEQSCMFSRIKASLLTEGDWVSETIKMNGKIIVKKDNLGITKEQIRALKHYKKTILVKTGIPFVPAFLLAFIALLLINYYGLILFK